MFRKRTSEMKNKKRGREWNRTNHSVAMNHFWAKKIFSSLILFHFFFHLFRIYNYFLDIFLIFFMSLKGLAHISCVVSRSYNIVFVIFWSFLISCRSFRAGSSLQERSFPSFRKSVQSTLWMQEKDRVEEERKSERKKEREKYRRREWEKRTLVLPSNIIMCHDSFCLLSSDVSEICVPRWFLSSIASRCSS